MKYILIAFLALGSVVLTGCGCGDCAMSKEMHPANCTCEKCVLAKKEAQNKHPADCACEKCMKEKIDAKK